ncbi:MAG: polysaccharide biosynthesis protein [Bacteriovoracaceae bacterium]|nr:polysaccharide biosynthesis protein [Bacteriovoracaceae bacterium]
MKLFEGKVVVITGGTGSLGKVLTRRILEGKNGSPKKVIIFSRDEAKQHFMRLEFLNKKSSTDELIYKNFLNVLEFRIGDIRDYGSVVSLLKNADIVVNAAALKQVPSCEYFPYEAVRTNIEGAENIVRAIREHNFKIQTVVGVSTDKACKPVNVMGMTKAIQEKVFISANISCPETRFICVRYGNVLASRGSVIPLFHEQIKNGGPLTITTAEMTRFLLPLNRAVDTIFHAIDRALPGETFIPRVPAANMVTLAKALIENRKIEIAYTGIRPGEKTDEVMISDEEAPRAYETGEFYSIRPMLPELVKEFKVGPLTSEYSSGTDLMGPEKTWEYLKENNLLIGQNIVTDGEFLR